MGLPKLITNSEYGLPRQDFEEALLKLSDICRITEQKLTLKIDDTIQQNYDNQIHKIGKITETLGTLNNIS